MGFELPNLPYPKNALEPHISEETLDFHYGKHHAGYLSKLNELAEQGAVGSSSLEKLIETGSGSVYENAAQAWNHSFYWSSMTPENNEIGGPLQEAVRSSFGSEEKMKERFVAAGADHFGSGWLWLVLDGGSGELRLLDTHDAGNPMRDSHSPILTCDLWEHAYYIDYRNRRAEYLEKFVASLANWHFAGARFEKARSALASPGRR